MNSLQVETRPIGTDERMITVIGEIDLATAPEFGKALKDCHGKVVVDLREVPFMDSTGLRVLLTEQNRLTEAGGSLRLLTAGGQIDRLLEITGLTEVFQVDHMAIRPEDPL